MVGPTDAPWPQRPHPWQKEPAFISTPATTVLARLLPDATVLRLEACEVDDITAQITLRVQSTQTRAPCPLCATPAWRIHSDYARTLADLPWAQYRVSLQLRVRKWFCGNRACQRRIFTERLPTVAAPWARRDGGVVILKVFPSKGHFFFGPQACDQSQCLVCEFTRAFERAPSGRPIGGEGRAHAESRQQTTL